jgi:N-dimethylarginine dimethylaminohydrolase
LISNEWSQLSHIIVGSVFHPDFPEIQDSSFRQGLEKIFLETQDDLNKLSVLFESLGVKTSRPKFQSIQSARIEKNNNEYPYPPLCPRDFLFIYKNQFIICRGGDRNRIFEESYFSDIIFSLVESGISLKTMPYFEIGSHYAHYKELEGQTFFHAACILKCDDTLIHSTPYIIQHGRGTYEGLRWIKEQLTPNVRWIQAPFEGHADGKIALLRPGLLMTWDPKFIPEELKSWDTIIVPPNKLPSYFQSLKAERFYKDFVENWLSHWIGHVDETVFDLNLVSVNEKLVITNGYDPYVFSELKKRNIEAIPFNFRHKYFWDSGLHCITLDLKRD